MKSELHRLPILLRRAQVMQVLGVNSQSITLMVRDGTLTQVRLRPGGYAKFLREDVQRLLSGANGGLPNGSAGHIDAAAQSGG